MLSEAEVGELRRIGPADDDAHRVECRPCTSFQPGERFRERGSDSGILRRECDLGDQRHELVLDPVVQVTLHLWPLVGRGDRSGARAGGAFIGGKSLIDSSQRSHGAAIVGRVKVSAHVSDLGTGWTRLDGQLTIDSLRNFAFGHFRSTSGLRKSNAGTPPRP